MVATEKKKQLIRILIIDDHQMVRDGIKVMLESQNRQYKFIVSEAESGEDGIKKVMKNQYDMLLVDYQLPGLSGAETVQNSRQRRLTGSTNANDETIRAAAIPARHGQRSHQARQEDKGT